MSLSAHTPIPVQWGSVLLGVSFLFNAMSGAELMQFTPAIFHICQPHLTATAASSPILNGASRIPNAPAGDTGHLQPPCGAASQMEPMSSKCSGWGVSTQSLAPQRGSHCWQALRCCSCWPQEGEEAAALLRAVAGHHAMATQRLLRLSSGRGGGGDVHRERGTGETGFGSGGFR